MDKINNITVNGITYEIGGTGGLGDNIYYIPTEIRKLSTGATKNDVDTALGGTGDGAKITELFDAIMAGKLILLKNVTTGAIMPVSIVAESTTSVYVEFIYEIGAGNPTYTFLGIVKIGTIVTVTFEKYKLTAEKITG